MTKEELLKRRFKVVADYPESRIRIGDILEDGQKEFEWWINNRDQSKWTFHPEEYPAIFKKLEWWEEREENDMPEYVMWRGKHVHKVNRYGKGGDTGILHAVFTYQNKCRSKPVKFLQPATLEEYQSFINSNRVR